MERKDVLWKTPCFGGAGDLLPGSAGDLVAGVWPSPT